MKFVIILAAVLLFSSFASAEVISIFPQIFLNMSISGDDIYLYRYVDGNLKQNLTIEVGLYSSNIYYPFAQVMQNYPEIQYQFIKEKTDQGWKWAPEFANIPQEILQENPDIVFKYIDHYGFNLNTLIKSSTLWEIGKDAYISFQDLKTTGFNLSLDQPNRMLHIGNLGAGFSEGVFTLDPTFSIVDVSTTTSILTNITAENKFTHLNISETGVINKSNVIFYYPLDTNTSITTVYDYGPREFDLTFNENARYEENASGNIGGFTIHPLPVGGSADDLRRIPSGNEVNFSDATFNIWIHKNDGGVESTFMALAVTGGNADHVLLKFVSTDDVLFNIDFGADDSCANKGASNTSVNLDDEWHMVTGVYTNDTSVELYIDGVLSGTTSFSGCTDPKVQLNNIDTTGWTFGTESGANDFIGWIDEIMALDIALTASQVMDLYNNQSSRVSPRGTQEFESIDLSDSAGDLILIQSDTVLPKDSYITLEIYNTSGGKLAETNLSEGNMSAYISIPRFSGGAINLTYAFNPSSGNFLSPALQNDITVYTSPTLVETSDGTGIGTIDPVSSENLVYDNEGNLHTAFKVDKATPTYPAYESSRGFIWNRTALSIFTVGGTIDDTGLVINSTNGQFFYGETSNDIDLRFSEDGVTWSSTVTVMDNTEVFYDPTCEMDSNDVMHCATLSSDNNQGWIWYTNSTQFNIEVQLTSDSGDESDYADLFITEDDEICIVINGADQDDADIICNTDGWARHEIAASTGITRTVGTANGDNLYVAFADTFDLWACNSTISNLDTWSCTELYDVGSGVFDIDIKADIRGGVHIVINLLNDDVFYFNSTGGGSGSFSGEYQNNTIWLDLQTIGNDISLAGTVNPSFNTPNATLNFLVTNATQAALYHHSINIFTEGAVEGPDVTAPIITDLRNTSTTNQSSDINWTVDEAANYTILLYNGTGRISEALKFTAFDTSFVNGNLGQNFSTLLNFTEYLINLTVCDSTGNCADNNTFNFTTAQTIPPVADTCTYPGSGDHTYQCPDNCVITEEVDFLGNSWEATGAGTITGIKHLFNYNIGTIIDGCIADI